MHNLKIGTMVLILNAQWQSYEGKKAQIISTTDTKVVVEVHDWFQREAVELAPEQVITLDQINPTTEGPFHTGDLVFLHEAVYGQARDQGQIGKVISAFSVWQKCLIELEEGDETEEDKENRKLCDFDDISLMLPERRLPDEDYLRAVARAVSRRGYWQRYYEWWQQQAEKKLWPIDELSDLYAASIDIKAHIEAEIATEAERQGQLLEQAFGGLTHAQKVKKWQTEWSSWTEYRSYNNEPTPEEKLLKAIFGDDASSEEEKSEGQEPQPETPEEHGQEYGYRNSGLELLERCEKHIKHLAQPRGYAYDAIPFRAIPSEVVTNAPGPISSPPALPPTTFQPVEPLTLPGREQALTLLEDEGEHFTAALARLASDADDAAVVTLLEKYEALQTREGYDNLRYHHINSVALALLATQREAAIDAVLKKELNMKFWGDASSYSVQGIMFKGSTHALFWDEENPWHISAGEEVQTAIARIWASVARYAPRFVALLCEYTCGLALFKHQATGEYSLGYFHLVPFTSYELRKYRVEPRVPADTSIHHLAEWLNQGDLCLLLGYPPAILTTTA
ncbi:hypothetical protein [Ktedonospora formicarum]|uniref:Uncharacterized protein n=1 Tax=Ktedonospora formicarum TaxID=2778364 RepID=A0A8J3IAC5_9CHLR|nr:hypothetical protein [Ktedonospora formicarum]GHO47634.1 hypothetical protein KSX_57970 [Ktedonospora formicarum]